MRGLGPVQREILLSNSRLETRFSLEEKALFDEMHKKYYPNLSEEECIKEIVRIQLEKLHQGETPPAQREAKHKLEIVPLVNLFVKKDRPNLRNTTIVNYKVDEEDKKMFAEYKKLSHCRTVLSCARHAVLAELQDKDYLQKGPLPDGYRGPYNPSV